MSRQANSSFAEHLRWSHFAAPGIMARDDGGLSRSYRYSGHDIASMDRYHRVALAEHVSDAWKRLGSRWCTHAESRRVEITGYPGGEWPTAASALTDRARQRTCTSAGSQFAMEHYLTLTQAPPPSGRSKVSALFLDDTTSLSDKVRGRQIEDMQRATDEFAALLRGTFPLLEPLDDDETLTFYHSAISTHRQHVRASSMPEHIAELLPDEAFHPGEQLSLLGEHYIALCVISGFPRSDHPHIFEALNTLPFEYRAVTRWLSQDRETSKSLLVSREKTHAGNAIGATGLLAKAIMKEDAKREDREARKLSTQAGDALGLLSERGFGQFTQVFVVMDRDKEECLRKRRELATVIRHQDYVVRDATVCNWKTWLGTVPGNAQDGRRKTLVSTRNFADMMPSATIWTGKPYDPHLAKLTGVKRPHLFSTDGTPYGLTTDAEGGAGHIFIGGTTGGGKSVLVNILAAQQLGWPGSQVIAMEIGRSGLGMAMANQANIYMVGDKASPLSFQPLAFVDEPEEARSASEWLQLCYELQKVVLTPQRLAAIDETLAELATNRPGLRTLTEYSSSVGHRDRELADGIRPYTHEGHYGHIFDGDSAAEGLKRSRWTMFELGSLMSMRPEAVVPALTHLFQRLTRWFDGAPTLFSIDECGTLLKDPLLEGKVNEALSTWRKLQVRVLLATQKMEQLTGQPELLANIMSACKTQIFAPDPAVIRETSAKVYREKCGLNDVELQRIARMAQGEYYVMHAEGGRRLFSLRPSEVELCFGGMSSPHELEVLDNIRAQHPPEQWAAQMLASKGLHDAAQELRRWRTFSKTGIAA